ncbi:myo-inosose-2 dehydratase [Horticoccus sp. 23ND18S-11]|uniref:myo-inosose-2 dehydratase n=1 Tax=Horticoccus sp. 23ND18S-11 TaxID=3391832 RepID=UPI0039C96C95
MSSPVHLRDCLVGANPIIWSNDDFNELAGDVPLDTILREMRAAGFAGSELGHAYPRTPAALSEPLARHHLRLVSGWHSTHLASRDLAVEEAAFRDHLSLLKTLGARVAIVAECTRCIHGMREAALGFDAALTPRLTEAEWPRFVAGLKHLAGIAAAEEMKIVYHHHMGTVIQGEADLERLLSSVPEIQLLLDPGHLAFAGIDPVAVASRHAARIGHVHLKSTRPAIVERVRREKWSFCRAVTEGVFTIPGDGSVDFPAIFRILQQADYRGWLVVEAEEDPVKVPALPKARLARAYVRAHAGV